MVRGKCKLYSSNCTVVAPREHTNRHDYITGAIHQQKLYNKWIIYASRPYCVYKAELMIEAENSKLYWNKMLRTDWTISRNKPDIVYTGKRKMTLRMRLA